MEIELKPAVGHLARILLRKASVITRAVFWRIPHRTKPEEISLKLGRYHIAPDGAEKLEADVPKSELTLESVELEELLKFIQENYEPFKLGVHKYIAIKQDFDPKIIDHLKALFANEDRKTVLKFIVENDLLAADLIQGLEFIKRRDAVNQLESLLVGDDLPESVWQSWLKQNTWVLGSDFVEILDDRDIDVKHISDFLLKAHDGFLDIIEIKKPSINNPFWVLDREHANWVPSSQLNKAIMQSVRYILEVEREANSLKFIQSHDGVKVVKPRCVLIFGRSNDWNDTQMESFRLLNSAYHNLSILTYDHLFLRAKRMLGLK